MYKLPKFQPELVVQAFPENIVHPQYKEPAVINTGRCMQWAYMCYRMFRNVELWSMHAHAFVRYQGLFFDSERLMGEKDWRDLPACNFGRGHGSYCQRCTLDAQRRTAIQFKKRWMKNPIIPDWRWYRKLVTSFVEKVNHESLH